MSVCEEGSISTLSFWPGMVDHPPCGALRLDFDMVGLCAVDVKRENEVCRWFVDHLVMAGAGGRQTDHCGGFPEFS